MRTSAWVGIIVVVLIVIGGIWYYVSTNMAGNVTGTFMPATTTSATSTDNMATSTATTTLSTSGAAMNATVTFDGTSFSPATVTIAQGGTVNFIDSSSNPFWVASDPHPIHNGYDGTTMQQHCAPGYGGPAPFDECSPGSSFSFTFAKVGSWGYHDHLAASIKGTVVVVSQ